MNRRVAPVLATASLFALAACGPAGKETAPAEPPAAQSTSVEPEPQEAAPAVAAPAPVDDDDTDDSDDSADNAGASNDKGQR